MHGHSCAWAGHLARHTRPGRVDQAGVPERRSSLAGIITGSSAPSNSTETMSGRISRPLRPSTVTATTGAAAVLRRPLPFAGTGAASGGTTGGVDGLPPLPFPCGAASPIARAAVPTGAGTLGDPKTAVVGTGG